MVDPKSFIPAGEKINLAEIRACMEKNKKVTSQIPGNDPTKDRGISGSQEFPRKRKSPGQSDRGHRFGPPAKNDDMRDKKSDGKKKNVVAEPVIDARNREVDAIRKPKQKHDDGRVVHLDALEGRHLFVEGVNHKSNAGSFWYLKDPEIGWKTGGNLIGDHDRFHLLPQPTEVLTRSLDSTAFQILSFAHIFQFREERSRKSEKNLDDEVASLRGECKRLGEEGANARDDFMKSRKELEEKSRKYDALCNEMEQFRGKYSHELETGEKFLNSSVGKNLLRSTGEKAIGGYRVSSAFRDEVIQHAIVIHDEVVVDCRKELWKTKLVPERIIMMIHHDIPEPNDVEDKDGSGLPMGDLLGGLGDEKMIEALRSNF